MFRLSILPAVLALLAGVLLVAPAAAQAPPLPPATFYGPAPLIDGEAAAEGTAVIAVDDAGTELASTTVSGGRWVLDVPAEDLLSVRFRTPDSEPSEAFAVVAASVTEATLNLVGSGPVQAEPDGEPESEPAADPQGLPNSGSGGLAGTGSAQLIWLAGGVGAIVLVATGAVRAARRRFPA